MEETKQSIIFKENLSREELIKQIGSDDPTVILFYFGENGLKYDGVKYYQKLIRDLNRKSLENTVLWDLTPWRAFHEAKVSTQSSNPNVDLVHSLSEGRLIGDKSANFFGWIIEEKNEDVIKFVHRIWKRESVFKASSEFKDSDVKIKDIFGDCKMTNPIAELDGGKSYSAFQYLEGIYLVNIYSGGRLCFVLPNDETKYYKCEELANDIIEFAKLKKSKSTQVEFLSFVYSNKPNHRPYNAGKRNIDKLTKDLLC